MGGSGVGERHGVSVEHLDETDMAGWRPSWRPGGLRVVQAAQLSRQSVLRDVPGVRWCENGGSEDQGRRERRERRARPVSLHQAEFKISCLDHWSGRL